MHYILSGYHDNRKNTPMGPENINLSTVDNHFEYKQLLLISLETSTFKLPC